MPSRQDIFARDFLSPPPRFRGLDIVHHFANRRSYREIWHHQPADPMRNVESRVARSATPICYGPHPEIDPELGLRGDIRCILGTIPKLESPADLEALLAGGLGGLAGNVAWSPEYPYNHRDWDDFRAALRFCEAHGLEMWFYDEAGYPSGHANQRTLEDHPEFLAQGLRWISHTASGPLEVTFPEGEPFAVVAVAKEGQHVVLPTRPRVELPQGEWQVFAFASGPVWEGTHADYVNIRYPNLLDAAAVRRFLDLTHEVYYKEAGDWFGRTLTGVFTDEPSLMMPIQPGLDDGLWHLHLPWVKDLPEVFRERCGYDVKEALPALIADVGPATASHRGHFWSTIARLLSTRCHQQIGEWCEAHKIAYTGHLLWEEHLHRHVLLHGDLMECLRWFGWPGYDALRAPVRDENPREFRFRMLGAKYISSAAHLFDKPHTMCETFGITEPHSIETFEHVLDVLVLLGLDRHGYYSIWDKLTLEERSRLNTHLGRVSLLGAFGRHRCEVAVLYPIASAWAAYDASLPPTEQREVLALDEQLADLAEGLMDQQIDFDFCDDRSLQQGQAESGRWRMGTENYRLLLVPPMPFIRKDSLQALRRAHDAGVIVVFAESFPSGTIEGRWEDGRFGKISSLQEMTQVARELLTERVSLQPPSASIWMTRRESVEDNDAWSEVYLLVNTRSSAYRGELILPGEHDLWWCDAASGSIVPAQARAAHNGTGVALEIEGYGLRMLAVRRTQASSQAPATQGSL